MRRLLLIDNRDSFTWNLAQAFWELGSEVSVVRGDELDLAGDRFRNASHVVVGPGPGGPAGARIATESLGCCRGTRPWLGVCLGHQILAAAIGARVVASGAPVHGKRDWVHHRGEGIFAPLPRPFVAARYHSLAVLAPSVPERAKITAWTDAGDVMGLGIPGEATWGVQFHPESFMTPEGGRLLEAFLEGVPCPDPRPGEQETSPASGDLEESDAH